MAYLNKKEYNETIKDIAFLIDIDIDKIDYPEIHNNSNGDFSYKRFIIGDDKEKYTYKSYKNENTSTYTLIVEDDLGKTTIESSEFDLGYKTIPRINIRVESPELEQKFIELTVTSFSIQALISIDGEYGPLTRFVSYEDPNFEDGCIIPFTCPFELRKFKAGEDHETKYGIEKRYLVLNPTQRFSSLTSQLLGARKVENEIGVFDFDGSVDEAVQSLLSNSRTISLFDYMFEEMDCFIPGVIDYLSEKLPFFRDTTDKMYAKDGDDEANMDFAVESAFLDIISGPLDTTSDKQKKLPS